jgi:arsenite methyltransferase
MAGAALVDDLQQMLRRIGFAQIRIRPKDGSKTFIRGWAPGSRLEDYVVSATIKATKPLSKGVPFSRKRGK